MAVIHKITAHCDREGCDETLEVPADTTQQWRFITGQGWSLDYAHGAEQISTFCPSHQEAS